jgi:hypothetical protein
VYGHCPVHFTYFARTTVRDVPRANLYPQTRENALASEIRTITAHSGLRTGLKSHGLEKIAEMLKKARAIFLGSGENIGRLYLTI